jgi:hypothetical protein
MEVNDRNGREGVQHHRLVAHAFSHGKSMTGIVQRFVVTADAELSSRHTSQCMAFRVQATSRLSDAQGIPVLVDRFPVVA